MYKEMSQLPGAKFVSGSDLAKIQQTLQQPDMMYLVIPVPHAMAATLTENSGVVPSDGETIPNKQITPTSSNE